MKELQKEVEKFLEERDWRKYHLPKEWVSGLEDSIYSINFHPGYYDPESKSKWNKTREKDAENIKKLSSLWEMLHNLPGYNVFL